MRYVKYNIICAVRSTEVRVAHYCFAQCRLASETIVVAYSEECFRAKHGCKWFDGTGDNCKLSHLVESLLLITAIDKFITFPVLAPPCL